VGQTGLYDSGSSEASGSLIMYSPPLVLGEVPCRKCDSPIKCREGPVSCLLVSSVIRSQLMNAKAALSAYLYQKTTPELSQSLVAIINSNEFNCRRNL
jgi:hypothetical protein